MSIESPNFRDRKTQLIEEAKHILEKKTRAGPQEKFELAKKLKAIGEFGYARKLLARARKVFTQDPVFRFKLRQQHALCTYKDQNLPLNDRLDRALEILSEEEDLTTTRNQETLGLAGAIHKRKWEADSQKQNLERSLAFYLRGYDEDPAYDFGYTGINAAFVLDKLATLEGGGTAEDDASDVASTRREQAREIRRHLVEILPKLVEDNEWLRGAWWVYVTIVEAYFGLKDYPNAWIWMKRAKQLRPDPWEFESTARQLVSLALLQLNEQAQTTGAPVLEELENGEAGALLKDFLAGEVTSIRSLITGKVGLALAGGGFRAALFHIGVLAKLAELDVLRSVEVLSCVSGGAIVGTHYYLEVRRLLESKGDEAITRDDYIALVQKLERDFLAGVQGNIRMRATASLTNGLRSLFRRDYSRSERLGKLFESELFARVDDGNNQQRRFLNELLIRPLNAAEGFTPKRDNWRRAAKVPILVLNSTTLNTGHNWQFTASCMGETPASINREIDANAYLRQMYYAEGPPAHQQMPLGRAVAASTCIPGLCEPIVLANLYPEMTVRLVDGGVHGCQGVTALLEQDCNVLLVCDATGEMETQEQPGSGLLQVPLRSSNIGLTQTRSLLYEELKARRQSNLLRGLMYVHLMKDLEGETVNWIGCDEPKSLDEDSVPLARRGPHTRYGIRKDVQASLAAIRTDLDSFSDVEAFALMTCGYRMTEYEFPKFINGFSSVETVRPSWRFLALEEPMKRAGSVEQINGTLQLLNVASNRGFKVWRLSRLAQSIAMTLFALVILAVFYLAYKFGGAFAFQINLARLLFVLVGISILLLVAKITLVVREIPKTLTEIAMDLGLVISGFLAARLYLTLLDPLYLRLGGIDRLSPQWRVEKTVEKSLPETSPGVFTRAAKATQSVVIQRPADAVGRLVDQSEPMTNRFVDRSILVEALCRLFETAGYQALRFPRTKELNPLSINLDLIALKDNRYFLAEVKTNVERTTPIDWRAAAELEVAVQALKAKTEKQESDEQNSNPEPIQSIEVRALLFLIDVTPDPSLGSFVEGKAIKTINYTNAQMSQIYEKAGQLLNLPGLEEPENVPLDGRQQEREAQGDALWAELKPYLTDLTGLDETRIQSMRQSSAA